MLILARRIGESIVIGDNITVTVVQLRSGRVRLGIEAPSDVSVHRQEVFERLEEEQREARQFADV